jgi:uroporphyrinogen-III synthase
VKIRSLFISTELPKDNELRQFCLDNDINLIAESLLSFEAVEHTTEFKGEVIFFSSIRCFEFYKGNIQNKTLAVYGQGTAAKILKTNPDLKNQIDFIGEQTNDPATIAKDLVSWLGNRTILFPLGSKSLKSISKHIPKSQVEEEIVYETQLYPKTIKLVDVCVFTSPSNVESYLQVNEKQNHTIYVAWGKSTYDKLTNLNFRVIMLLAESSYKSLIKNLVLL